MRKTTKEEVSMDEMKIKLSTRFMRNIASKIITKAIYKQTGFKPKIQLNEIAVEMSDVKIYFHVDADGELDEKALLKISKMVEEEEP